MNLLDIAKQLGPNDRRAPRAAKASNALASYDNLAGSALLRRAAKTAGHNASPHADPASKLLAARRKEMAVDQLGRELSIYYESMLRQPVPERIVALVEALDAQQSR